MRGRRRVGKSRLVEEFARRSGSPYVFYTAVKGEIGREVDRFNEALGETATAAGGMVRAGTRAETWEAALGLIAVAAAKDRPTIVILDEFPYLIEKDPSIEAVLQKVWDRTLQEVPVLVVVIGSDEAMMAALSEQGRPLYDRARDMVIYPLTPADIGEMLDLSPIDALDAYLVIGGFPVLALEWGRGRNMAGYLADALTDPGSFLVISGERALAAEFPVDAQARRVLNAIGSEARAHRKIQSISGLGSAALARALEVLLRKRAVERLTPYSTKASPRNTQWFVRDPYLRFWLRFVNGSIELLERGRGDVLLERHSQDWSGFRGRAVEPVVRDCVARLLHQDRFGGARHVGSYWTRSSSAEVDLVGGDKAPVASEIPFVGSIKWHDHGPFTRRDAAALATQRGTVPGATEETRLIGVASHGFEDDLGLDEYLGPEDLVAAWRR